MIRHSIIGKLNLLLQLETFIFSKLIYTLIKQEQSFTIKLLKSSIDMDFIKHPIISNNLTDTLQ
jgi:hypothetical protein